MTIKLPRAFWVMLCALASIFMMQSGHASRIINSVTLAGGASVTVPPTSPISVTMNVTTNTGGGNPRWRSSGWLIASSPVVFACVNHPNHDSPGTYTETFPITAPAIAGTYNAYFIAFNDNNCGGAASPIYTLTNGVIVTPPVVASMVLNNPNPTALTSVSWTVTFNRSVTGVDASDFSLVAGGGLTGASITSVSGSGTTWTITATTGSGDGTLGLNLVDNDSIIDAWSNPLGGVGANNGNFTGPVYTITRVSQFDVVEVGAARATPIFTKVAGAGFFLDVLALDTAGAVSTGYTGTVSVALVDASAGGCAALPTIQAAFSITFVAADAGRKTVSFNYANAAPNVRVRVISISPAITSCSTDNFAIRPAGFSSVSASDFDAQTAGIARTLSTITVAGATFHKAGRPFSLQATAVTAGAAIATNYAGSPAVGIMSDCGATDACVLDFGVLFGVLTMGAWSSNPGPGASGSVITNTATYSEVGAFSLLLQDQTFANVDSADTPASCSNVAPIGRYICQTAETSVGRFTPDHFDVTFNTPILGTTCSTFSYIGQPFNYVTAPVMTVTARNFANDATLNYAGPDLWRLTNASLTYPAANKGYSAVTGTVDTVLVPATDPVIVQSGGGVGTLTFSSGAGLSFTRAAPVAPFNAEITLSLNVADLDGISYAGNPARFGAALPGIAFNSANLMRFGRLRLNNAHGSELLDLPVPMEAQYWNGALFTTNTLDNCTVITPSNIALSVFQKNLVACETAISLSGALVSGKANLKMLKPGVNNSGSVDLTVNLGSAPLGSTCLTVGGGISADVPANFTYLQGKWSGASYDKNPSARATFGVYKNANEFIYLRENF